MSARQKPPERWGDVIANTPRGALTKKDVYDYYNIPEVQQALLDATRDRDVTIMQSFSPEKQVLRRLERGRLPIRFETPEDFRRWQAIRMSEVHPAFRETEPLLLADIDPQPGVSWERTKELTALVARALAEQPDVQGTSIQFSGGRGFHVRGQLANPISTAEARARTKKLLRGILREQPDTTLGVPREGQVRLDTTPLHPTGSLRAPYSLNMQTGLASAPVALEELPGLQQEEFTPQRVLDRLAKYVPKQAELNAVERGRRDTQAVLKLAAQEFAPGIPASRKIRSIPRVKDKTWQLAIQQHDADRAGSHWDVRLVDPRTDRAHSFAVPKHRFPTTHDRMLLAVQQATHSGEYARTFEGEIPKGTYGAGRVSVAVREPVKILESNDQRIRFERPDGDRFTLFRTTGKNWGWKVSGK